MSSESNQEDQLRRYLLGLMSEEEAAELEEVYLLNDELNDDLQAAERELIDRYVDGSLSSTERERFERFFLCTPGRHERLRFAKTLRAYGQTTPVVAANSSSFVSFMKSYAGIGISALLLIALGIAAWRLFLVKSPDQESLLALSRAYTNGRLIESRISGLNYAPMAQLRGTSNPDATSLAEAELIALKEERENPGPTAFHALGRVYLAKQELDKAIEWLEKAAKARPDDAGIQSDLGAAFLEKGRQEPDTTKRAEMLIKSLHRLDTALLQNDSLLEARFNRALLYEQMHLPERAKTEWQRYIESDPNSGWSYEAKKRLAQLEQKQSRLIIDKESDFVAFLAAAESVDEQNGWSILSRNRSRGENAITQRLLDESLEGNARLNELSFAGKLEREKSGDRLTTDLASYYLKTSPTQRELIKRGRTLLKSASRMYETGEFESAAQLYRQAESVFARAGDTGEVLIAQSGAGACYLRVPYVDEALATFKRIVAHSSERNYKVLLARALLSIADAEGSRREFSKSLESASKALDVYESLQDSSGVLWSLQSLMVNYYELGELYKSTGFAMRALDIASSFAPGPRELWPLYKQTASNLSELGFPAIALGFSESALRLAIESNVALLRSRSYSLSASIHQKLHKYDEALKYAQLALAEADNLSGKMLKANLIAHSTLNLAHIYRERGDFSQALSFYDRSIQLHRELGQLLYVAEAHGGKLESLVALNDEHAIGEQIQTAISILEDDRARITEDANRSSYFDLAQNVYDRAIDFTYSRRQDRQTAFDYAESSHARSLLDLVSNGGEVVNSRGGMDVRAGKVAQPLKLDQIQQRLPDHSQLLQYSVLEDKLIAWVVSKSATESTHVSVNVRDLTARVTNLINSLTKGEEIKHEAEFLYEVLIRPAKPNLDPGSVIFIVPDKILNVVPFAALVNPETGKYLIEDYVIAIAPSASLMIKSSERAAAKSRLREESALVIGNPSFDVAKFQMLASLPAAMREAESVAELYRTTPLTGVHVLENHVRARMPRTDVIHFAGHYVADERSPLMSKLLLSKSTLDQDATVDGVLTASEVYRMNLSDARVVVLSACTTGVERYYRGEGAIGMARPFIEAGASLVVASLWPVASEPTSRLMIEFHKRRKLDRMTTIHALRQAQLDMLASAEPTDRNPHTWAAFLVIGGHAEF